VCARNVRALRQRLRHCRRQNLMTSTTWL
jgi:hypothetical protein